jgi:MSHA pilin protein MshC
VRPTRHTGGFTLIELVACIVIMAVLAAIAGPRFFSTQSFAQQGYAAEIVAALRASRQVAVSSECEVRFTIDSVTGYQVAQRALATCNSGGAWNVPVGLSDGNLLAGAPPSNASVLAPATVVFGPQGQAAGATTIVIGPSTISIDPISGFVTK